MFENDYWNFSARLLHWLTVLLVIACISAVWSHESFAKGDPTRALLVQLHFLLGVTIGGVTVGRLLNRTRLRVPHHHLAPLLDRLSRAGHFGLYLLLLALPVCGYVAVSGKGAPIHLFGLIDLAPLPVGQDLAHTVHEVHEVLANVFIGLVAVHVVAALYHAAIRRDGVLRSMTTGRRR